MINLFLEFWLTTGSCACPRYLEAISFVFPLMLMMAWVLFVADFVKKLVHERELRLHEVTFPETSQILATLQTFKMNK